jgi:hypothetical protein
MSKIEVDAIEPQSGTTLTIGASGDIITIPAGSAAAPVITTTGDTNTGMFFPAADTIAFTEGGTEAMRINSNGDVGIGTTNPENFSGFITQTINGSTGSIIAFQNGGTGGTARIVKTATQLSVEAVSAIPILFNTSNTERMRINSSGGVNVGSGVLSAASGDGDIVVDLGIVIGTYNGDNRIAASSLGGGSATLYIGNAAIQVSSDRRLKTNIADTTMSAVDKIKQIRIVDFNWNDPSDTSYNNRNARGTWTGVIAQELIDVFPFAVNAPRKEEDLSIDTESEKKWQVDQAHLVPVLMKAIQEQQTTIEQLEARITALENK